jgi:predicted nuclease of predicted toxin-antitoxin system
MFKEPPPKVIPIRFGNMSMKEFHKTIKEVWSGALEMNKEYKLVNVYKDKIERRAINNCRLSRSAFSFIRR